MENRENHQSVKDTSIKESGLDIESEQSLVREESRRRTIWKSLSKVFTKKKPKRKVTNKYDKSNNSNLRNLILPQQLTSIGQSQNGYQAAFTEHTPKHVKEGNLAILVRLPEDIKDNDIAIKLEFNISKSFKSHSFEKSLESKSLHCIKETDSQAVFMGSLKMPNKTNFLNVLSMPLYVVNSKENVIVNLEGLNHETILKTSHDTLLTSYGKGGSEGDVQVKLILTNLRKVKGSTNTNEELNESGKFEVAASLARKEKNGQMEPSPRKEVADGIEVGSAKSVFADDDIKGEDEMHRSMCGRMLLLKTSQLQCEIQEVCNISTQLSFSCEDSDFYNCHARKCGHCGTSEEYMIMCGNTAPSTSYQECRCCDMSTQHYSSDIVTPSNTYCQWCTVNTMSTPHSYEDAEASTSRCNVANISTQYSPMYCMKDEEVDVQTSLCDIVLPLHVIKDSGSSSTLSYALGDLSRSKNKLSLPSDSKISSDITAWPSSSTAITGGDTSTLPSLISEISMTREKQHSQGFILNKMETTTPLESTIHQKSWSPMTTLAIKSSPKMPKEYPSFPSATCNFEGKTENLMNEELCFTNTRISNNITNDNSKPRTVTENSDQRYEVIQNVKVHIPNNPFRYCEDLYKSYYEDNDRYYETHRENVKSYFENKNPKARTESGGDSTQSVCDTKVDELKACFMKMGDILATTSSNVNEYVNNCDKIKEDSDAQLSRERLETYEKAENGIQQIIKELLNESEKIKESVLLQGAKEESEPPVILDYIKTEPNYEELCVAMMNEMGKYEEDINEDVLVMIESIINEIIENSTNEPYSHTLSNNEDMSINSHLTYFPNSYSIGSKIPKTSYSFGEVFDSYSTHPASHSSTLSMNKLNSIANNSFKDLSNDNVSVQGAKVKTERFLTEELEKGSDHIHTITKCSTSDEEIFQRSVSLNSITNIDLNEQKLKKTPTCKITDEEVLIQNVNLIQFPKSSPPKTEVISYKKHENSTSRVKNQTECNSSSEEEICFTLSTILEIPKGDEPQPSTSSAKELRSKVCTPLDSKDIILQEKPATHNIRQATKGENCKLACCPLNFKILEDADTKSSDADDENENIPVNLNLPKFRYKSKQELNTPQEIAEIERNLHDNEICVRKGKVLSDLETSQDHL